MTFIEYGKENQGVILLLHGGGLSWWNYREAAEKLAPDFHVVLPVLDGHSESDADFCTIEENAQRIIDFIDERFGGEVLLMGGLSLGGQILVEILSRRKDICRYALIESALVLPSPWTHKMIRPVFGSCYGLIRKRWFSKLQYKSLRIKDALFEDYYRDTCAISKANMIAFLEANAAYGLKASLKDCRAKAFVYVGEKENNVMKKSADLLHRAIPESELTMLPGMYHGEFSINHADEFADTIRTIIRKA